MTFSGGTAIHNGAAVLREAFARESAKPDPGQHVEFLDAILRERPDLRGKPLAFAEHGLKGHTVIIGDEVFKAPKAPTGECRDDFETECRTLATLDGCTFTTAIPRLTTVGRDFLFFGMTRVPGEVLGSDFTLRLSRREQKELAKDIVNFIIEMARALPGKDGKFATHDDLHYTNIFIDPKTKKLTGIIDFGQLAYKSPEEWLPKRDFRRTPLYDFLGQEFDRRKGELPGAVASCAVPPAKRNRFAPFRLLRGLLH
jgi:hypothetical protein